jgi:hypothetical protein
MASKCWEHVTQEIFECVKAKSKREHGTVYEPPNGDSGISKTETSVGKIVLKFDLSGEKLCYAIVEKPWIVTEGEIWDGIESAIDSCRGEGKGDG